MNNLLFRLQDWFEFSGFKCLLRGYHTPDAGTIHGNCTTCYRDCYDTD